jgi:hypothetical protein
MLRLRTPRGTKGMWRWRALGSGEKETSTDGMRCHWKMDMRGHVDNEGSQVEEL